MRFKKALSITALFGTMISLYAFAADKVIEDTIKLSAGKRIDLKTSAGGISITSHDLDEVQMRVEVSGRRADEFIVETEIKNGNLYIDGDYESRSRWSNYGEVQFTLVVPKEVDLELNTSGGAIDVSNIAGNVEAHSSGGSLDMNKIVGDLDVHTSGGSVDLDEIDGGIDAHTSGGSMRLTMPEKIQKDVELRTSGGSIKVYLNEALQANIEASTSGGWVNSEFPISGRIEEDRIDGTINGGGNQLDLHTSGGNIKINKL